MIHHSFSLHPFKKDKTRSPQGMSPLTIGGVITRQENTLEIEYQLSGQLASVSLPSAVQTPSRQDDLWQTTCFEFFLGLPEQSRYWEFNLSPTQNWNVYRFDDYRQGMYPEPNIQALPWTYQQTPQQYQLHLTLNLDRLISPKQPLQAGITAVINHHHHLSYWALAHPGPEADFHRRDSFILKL